MEMPWDKLLWFEFQADYASRQSMRAAKILNEISYNLQNVAFYSMLSPMSLH